MEPPTAENALSRRTRVSGRAREIIAKLGIAAAMTVAMLALIETGSFWVLRRENVTPLYRHLASSTLYQGEPWANDLKREMRHSLNLDYRPYVVWEAAPLQGKAVVIGQDGLRRTWYSQCDDGKAYTIWMFGGSTLWGWGSPDWATIPSQLAQRYEKSGRTVCVRNYGQPAWVNTQEVIQLFLELKRATRPPDLVVFYDGVNDAYSFYQSGGRIDVHHNVDSIARGFKHLEAARGGSFEYWSDTNTAQLLLKVGLWLREQKGETRVKSASDADLKRQLEVAYLKNLELVELLARQYGFAYAFFWQPCLLTGAKPLTREELALRHDADHELGREAVGELGRMYDLVRGVERPHLFCITDAFDKQSETLYLDWMHVGPQGNGLIAARMFGILAGSVARESTARDLSVTPDAWRGDGSEKRIDKRSDRRTLSENDEDSKG